MTTQNEPLYPSYKKYIDQQVSEWPEYQWLQYFLSKPGSQLSQTQTTIFDIIDGTLIEKARLGSGSTELLEALKSRPTETKTRLIIVSYHESWSVSRDVVDLLGWFFDIDPDFFRRHFYYPNIFVEELYDDSVEVSDNNRKISILPSEADTATFELGFTRNYDHLSLFIHTAPVSGQKTALIWQRAELGCHEFRRPIAIHPEQQRTSIYRQPTHNSNKSSGHLDIVYLDAIQRFSVHDLRDAEEDPVYYIYPYARAIMFKHYVRFEKLYKVNPGHWLKGDSSNSEMQLGQIRFELTGLQAMEREITRIMRLVSQDHIRSKFQNVLDDISSLKALYQEISANHREAKKDILVKEQLKEAKESKDVAVSVGRLSKLAFIFIPLSFTTSVFGMNISQFGQGTVSIRTFLVTAAAISLASLIPVAIPFWKGAKNTWLPRFLLNTKVISRLAHNSLLVAFWYAVLCTICCFPLIMGLCGRKAVDVFELDNGREKDSSDGDIGREEAFDILREFWFSNFWLNRVDSILSSLQGLEEECRSTSTDRRVSIWPWKRGNGGTENSTGETE